MKSDRVTARGVFDEIKFLLQFYGYFYLRSNHRLKIVESYGYFCRRPKHNR